MKFILLTGITAITCLLLAGLVRASDSRKGIELNIGIDPHTLLDKNQSYIALGPLPDTSVADNTLSFPVFIYRGKTLKRTVYVWMEDSDGKRLSSKAKFSLPERFRSYNLTAHLNITGCSTSNDYYLIAEGLDIIINEEIRLNIQCGRSEEQTPTQTDGRITFHVESAVDKATSGIPFHTRLRISNPTGQDLEVSAWSYVYRSSRCYSGEREQNRKTINLPAFANVTFDLENTVDAPDGNYTLKLKFLRSDRKNPKEINLPIEVSGKGSDGKGQHEAVLTKNINENPDNATKPAEKRSLFRSQTNSTNSSIVYESSSAKARNLTVYFLILVLFLILVVLVFKRL